VDKAMPQVPTVKVGPDGRAMTAWMTFQTVASPTHPARTSGGYRVLTGAGTGPDAAARPRSTATGQDSGSQAAAGPVARDAENASGASSTEGDADGGLTGSLPGGRPTFYLLLALLASGAVAGVTMRLRQA